MIRKFISIILSLSMILSFGTLVFAAENNQNEEQFMVGRDSDTKELFIEEINGLANEDIQGTVVEKKSDISTYTIFDESKWGPVVTNANPTKNLTFPYRAIVRILFHFPNGQTTIGSGCLISDGTVLTAGHCAYNEAYGGLALSAAVYAGYNMYKSYKTSSSKKIYTNSIYRKEAQTAYAQNPVATCYTSDMQAYDYATVVLKDPIGKNNHLGLRKFNLSADGGKNFILTGYPGEKSSNAMKMYTGKEKLYSNYYNPGKYKNKLIQHKINTTSGNSGSSIYSYNSTSKTYQIVAVNIAGTNKYNIGRVVDQTMLNFVNSSIEKE